jgi:CMP-N-acetylneuraminic acid synthetase/spore coat polysaccharide biosynthesis predicted glycosyltransferase SpsG
MFQNKKILAVIPARWGSKWIPKKNIKPLHWKPLIHYIIDTLKKSDYIDDIILTTDSEEIKNICKDKNILIHKRLKELSKDSVPLDPVIYDIAQNYKWYDYIITFQPTSPLIRINTIDKSIKKFITENTNSLISLKEETHLYWKEENSDIIPDFNKRVNRQLLPKKFVETWAIIWTKFDYFIKSKERLDLKNCTFVITKWKESIDIDTFEDWIYVESLIKQKNIAINVIWSEKTGLWHIYRQLHIALYLNTKPIFFTKEWNNLAESIIKNNFYEIITYNSDEELFSLLEKNNIDIIINDILNTTEKYIRNLKNIWLKIINFEDLWEWKNYSDYTINELYEFTEDRKNILHWHKYIILREDIINQKKKTITKDVKNITISCWWTDPNNLTLLYLKSLINIKYNWKINIILWPWYSHKNDLLNFIKKSWNKNINILEDVNNMWEIIYNADLILTSNGRTIYEITCIWTPAISVSQNEQEMHHTFANFSWCIKNLGLINFINEQKLEEEIKNIINDFKLRKSINKKMLSYNLENWINNFLNILQSL